MTPFNKPYITGKETTYITQAVELGHISGNGLFTKKCQAFFEEKYGFNKCLLTTSCTDALEMCALLLNIQPGDEVIVPAYTFVSTALAFVRQGAKIVFCDSHASHPNLDETLLESLITQKTKAIVVVHYAGVACNMDAIMEIATRNNIYVVEDAAQAIDSFYNNKPLGSIGHLGCFSFHETKNIQCGEGGMLAINSPEFEKRAEIIWEKGTNRAEFFRGETNKYQWCDIGSSFLPSDITAAFLLAQLENLEAIQAKRTQIWNTYFFELKELQNEGFIETPTIPASATNNAHMFYLECRNEEERNGLIDWLKKHQIHAVFHYLALHNSKYYNKHHDGRELPNTMRFEKTIIRLPFFTELTKQEINHIISQTKTYFNKV